MPVKEIVENEAKLRELILYIAQQQMDDDTFGATKLNKLLFHIDFLAYGLYDEPITGTEYMKLENGPAPRRLKPIRDDMKAKDELVIIEMPSGRGKPRHWVLPMRAANPDLFSGREIALIDRVLSEFRGVTGEEMAQLTHGYRAWRVAPNLKDTIPYPAVFLSDEPPTAYEQQHAEELIQQHGWDV